MQASVSFFKKHGYVILPNVFSESEIDRVLGDAKQLVDQQLKNFGLPVVEAFSYKNLAANMKSLLDHDVQRYLATVRLVARLGSIQRLFGNASVERFLKCFGHTVSVMQSDCVFHIMGESLKIPNGYSGFDAHQDWTALQSSLDMVSIWIPFVDVDESNYPMELVPGSHLAGLAAGVEEDHIYRIDESVCADSDFIPVIVNRTDAVMMSSFTIHRSGRYGDVDKVRLAVSHRYENGGEPTFIERGYPFSQRKIIERALLVEGFPKKTDLDVIFDD